MTSFFKTVAIVAIVATMTSCRKENGGTKSDQPQKLTITARIDAPETRATMAEGAEGVLKTTWEEYDVIRVINPISETYATFEIDEVSPDGATATFTGEISGKGGQLYAVHSTNGMDGPGWFNGNEFYGFKAPDLGYFYTQDRNGSTANLRNFAILVGSFSTENPSVTFSHTMAFFKFTLTLPAGETIPTGGSATITLDVPTERYPAMNLATGEWLLGTDPWSEGILRVMVYNLDEQDTEIVGYMAVFPSDAGGRDIALTMEVSNGSGSSVTYGKTLAAKTPRLIESGRYYTITEQLAIPVVENVEEGGIATLTPEEF